MTWERHWSIYITFLSVLNWDNHHHIAHNCWMWVTHKSSQLGVVNKKLSSIVRDNCIIFSQKKFLMSLFLEEFHGLCSLLFIELCFSVSNKQQWWWWCSSWKQIMDLYTRKKPVTLIEIFSFCKNKRNFSAVFLSLFTVKL